MSRRFGADVHMPGFLFQRTCMICLTTCFQHGSARVPMLFFSRSNINRSVHVKACCFGCCGRGATPRDHRVLPKRIILVRHAESEGNVDHFAYSNIPDPQVSLVRAKLKYRLPLLGLHVAACAWCSDSLVQLFNTASSGLMHL